MTADGLARARGRTRLSTDCSSLSTRDDGNNGCSVDAPYTASYGKVFNTYGGGYYALERTAAVIRVWFWARNDTSIPSDITSGASTINTSKWVRIKGSVECMGAGC